MDASRKETRRTAHRARVRGHRACTATAATLLLLGTPCSGRTAAPDHYDLSAECSFARNPNGVWQYGFSATKSLAPDQFRLFGATDTRNTIGFWHPAPADNGGANYYPYGACNQATRSLADPTKSWAIRPGEVAMEASNSGQYSLVRFVAPQDGDYRVKARFEGIHFRLSSTDVHVLRNATPLFDADIDGYGGDPAFHAVEGPAPSASYSGSLHLEADDVLTFAVGYGRNQTHFNDTTGLLVWIRRVTQPVPADARPSPRGSI